MAGQATVKAAGLSSLPKQGAGRQGTKAARLPSPRAGGRGGNTEAESGNAGAGKVGVLTRKLQPLPRSLYFGYPSTAIGVCLSVCVWRERKRESVCVTLRRLVPEALGAARSI